MLAAAFSLGARLRGFGLFRSEAERNRDQVFGGDDARRRAACTHQDLIADSIADVYCAACGEDLTA